MSDLLDTIDAAAASLLDAAGFGAKVEGAEPPKVELSDRVKAFQAVVDWAKTRNVLKPPERGKTKFDDIKRQFRTRRTRRPRPRRWNRTLRRMTRSSPRSGELALFSPRKR